MKKMLLILAIFASGCAFAQDEPKAIEGVRVYIDLKPSKVYIATTHQFIFLGAKDSFNSGKFFIFLSDDSTRSENLIVRGGEDDSIIVLDGAAFKPLSRFTKKQWKRIKKEMKIKMPYISQAELDKTTFYFLFNSYIWSEQKYRERLHLKPKPEPYNPFK